MARAKFHLYLRQHNNKWHTASVLTLPEYAAYGPFASTLREEIGEVLERDLATGELELRSEHHFDGLVRRTLNLSLTAVQHERLTTVPMRFTVLYHPLGDSGRFEVRIPRIGEIFNIYGEENIEPWATEIIRGHFHLEQVMRLLEHQYERSEQIETLEVVYGAHRKRRRPPSEADPEVRKVVHPLAEFGQDLTEEASEGRLPAVLFRDALVTELLTILSSKRTPSVLLVGPSGVGKTAVVNGFVQQMMGERSAQRQKGAEMGGRDRDPHRKRSAQRPKGAEGGRDRDPHRKRSAQRPKGAEMGGRALPDRDPLYRTHVWFITGSRIVAGAKFLGEWQERCSRVVDLIRAERDILFIGNLLDLLTSGSTKSGLNVAQFLLPSIRSGEISVIAEATPDALAVAERINTPFVRAFQRLPVTPLEAQQSTAILERSTVHLSKQHGVDWDSKVTSAVLDLIARFGDPSSLPGAGLALLDQMARSRSKEPIEVGHGDEARYERSERGRPAKRIEVGRGDEARYERSERGRPAKRIGPRHAIRAFANTSGFPESLIDPDELLDVERVRRFFHQRIIGQQHATDLLTDLIMLLKAGLNDPEKPLGSFLFMGPTGVGKTETALTLAEYLFGNRQRLVRIDMSELGHPGSAWRLVDGPDGEGELTKKIREQPFCVLLLDEIEKADPGVFDVLLQVLGEGRLTDGTGKIVRFTHTIVIMTSNLGAKRRAKVGFEPDAAAESQYLDAAVQFFRPELMNRIDHLVPFSDLSRGAVRQIAKMLLDAALEREGFVRRGIRITYDEAGTLDLLLQAGFDPKYGARPMKRAVDTLVVVPLAKRLMGRSEMPSKVMLEARGGALQISEVP